MFELVCIIYLYKPITCAFYINYHLIKNGGVTINPTILTKTAISLIITYITNVPLVVRKLLINSISIINQRRINNNISIFRLLRKEVVGQYYAFNSNIAIIVLDGSGVVANPDFFRFREWTAKQIDVMIRYQGFLNKVSIPPVQIVQSRTPNGVIKEHFQAIGIFNKGLQGCVPTHFKKKNDDYIYETGTMDKDTKILISTNDSTIIPRDVFDIDQKAKLLSSILLDHKLSMYKNINYKTTVVHNSLINKAYYEGGVKIIDVINDDVENAEIFLKFQNDLIANKIDVDTIKQIECCVSNKIDFISNFIDRAH